MSMSRNLGVLIITVVLAAWQPGAGWQAGHQLTHIEGLGSLSFPNSGNAAAQPAFIRGVLLLHSFEFEPAAEAFREAQKADPGFALAYWGEAMTYNHPLWQQQDRDTALRVLARLGATPAARAAKAPTDRERQYLAALDALYGAGARRARDEAYMHALARLQDAYPDDHEARTFHALAILGSRDGVRDFATYMRAAAVAQPVFDANPDHPGAAHYLIHAFDDPIHAPLGLPAARKYATIAPGAAHAQHMTSHIFVAMGMWDDVIAANIRARDTQDAENARRDRPANVCGHYSSWLQYGHLMRGDTAQAAALLDKCHARVSAKPTGGEVAYFVSMRARQILDTEDWSLATRWTWSPPTAGSGPGSTAAWTYGFTNAFAALRRGDMAPARALLATPIPNDDTSRLHAEELRGLVALAAGQNDEGLRLLRAAADAEDALPYEFGPPSIVKPTHELLGEELTRLGRSDDARMAFARATERTPGRPLAAGLKVRPPTSPAGQGAGTSRSPAVWPPPRFADPARVDKLAAAFPEIDAIFQKHGSTMPGYAYGVIIDGELRHMGVGGVRDVVSQARVDADTVFRIASMTKSFTAMAILKLRDEGRLSLDDPAERYVPELASLTYPTSDSPRITVRHLLSHSEGFPEDNPWGDQQLARTDAWLGEAMRSGIPFSNPPGLAYEYSNYGFGILGRIVSRVAGRPYRDYIAREILTPLGMTATTLEPTEVPAARLAHGYRREDNQWKEEPPLPDGAFGSMGGMLTSLRDLHKYVAFLMSAWPPRDGADTGPVKRASLREMQQLARPAPASVSRNAAGELALRSGGYGFGLGVRQTCVVRHVVSHSGGLPGYGSVMQWYPEHGVGFIAMGNITYAGWGGTVENATAALVRTGAFLPREPQPSAALIDARERITSLIQRWDDKAADAIAADNLFLDQSKDRRRQALETLRAEVGACRSDPGFEVENALRGRWTMTCDRGRLQVAITLAPTMPPKVQYWAVSTRITPPAATCPER